MRRRGRSGRLTDRTAVRVLVVDDDASMGRLMRHLLEMEGYGSVRHVWNGEEATAAAPEAEIILLDQQLPDIKGLDLLPRLLDRADPPSVVMVTGHGSELLAAAALRQGAEDYLTKDHTLAELLPRVLERVRRMRALRGALAAAEEDLVAAERLAAVGELSVTLHHEINNPLMAALSEVDLALLEAGLPAATREGLATAREALLVVRDTVKRVAGLQRARSTDYLDGRQRLDLDQVAGESAPKYRGVAVLASPEPQMTRVLTRLLRHQGFEVDRVASLPDAMSAVSRVGVTLVVITAGGDPTVPLGGFTPPGNRSWALVVLGGEQDGRAIAAGADLQLGIPFDPATVADEILRVVSRTPRS